MKEKPKDLGHYSGKYALSGIVFCGECGARYKRVTWARNGQKKIVWRCTERLRSGTANCKTSPTILEADLKTAVIEAAEKALQNSQELMRLYQEKVLPGPNASARSGQIYWTRRMREIDESILNLAGLAAQSENPELFDSQFTELVMEQKKLEKHFKGFHDGMNVQSELSDIFNLAVRILVQRIIVVSSGKMKVVFVDGGSELI